MNVRREQPELRIPPSRQASCAFCSNVVDTNAANVYRWTSGWTKNRKAGGTNAIRLPEFSPRWACRLCVDALVAGGCVGQSELFAHEDDRT